DDGPLVARIDNDGRIWIGPPSLKEAAFTVEGLDEELYTRIRKHYLTATEGHVYTICDYTGRVLSLSRGHPFRPSIEAVLPFIVFNNLIRYHDPLNVCNIPSCLNWLKGRHPIIVLPVLGRFLRAYDEPKFEVRKAIWTRAYTEMLNVGIIGRIFGSTLTHKQQIDRWQQWPLEKLRQFLELWRTGEFGPVIQEELDSGRWGLEELFLTENANWGTIGGNAGSHVDWKVTYRWLVKIAKSYGLAQEEFDYYCAVPAPGPSKDKVFFPYHVLSRPLAIEMGYSWSALYRTAHMMLANMRSGCNRHAEKAGYGEPEMNALRLIYWWAHHLCRQIRDLKRERPDTPREEIAFDITDRFGLLIVPWAANRFKASLCKIVHGVAMKFGLALKPGEEFDPVNHWDHSLGTVTIDAQGTNMAMLHFAESSSADIRHMISCVPLAHSYWSVHPDLGREPWAGPPVEDSKANQQPVQYPSAPPKPAPPLVPIDTWLDGRTPLKFECAECPDAESFPSPGLLLRHYEERHNGSVIADLTDPAQDDIDKAYWESVLRCPVPGCGKECLDEDFVKKHMNDIHSEADHVCPTCDKEFSSDKSLKRHLSKGQCKGCQPPGEHACHACSNTYTKVKSLQQHIRNKHPSGRKKEVCPTCGKDYARAGDLANHIEKFHP
ncbi:hypothetical protein C8A01DRAFT_16667, partial [Parachaetomium inaequale]